MFPQWWNACLKGWDWGGYCYTTAWQSREMWGSTVLTHSLRFQTSSWLEEIPRFSSPQKRVKTSGIPIILGTKDRPGCYTTSRTLLTSSFTCNKPLWRTTQCPTSGSKEKENNFTGLEFVPYQVELPATRKMTALLKCWVRDQDS